MAGMDHKDFRALLPCRSHARCVQRQVPLVLETVQAQFLDKVARARVVIRHVPMVPETVQAQFLDKVVCYVWCHGPDSAVHCLAVPQLQFITVVDTPYALWQFPMVLFAQKTIEIPQFVLVVDCVAMSCGGDCFSLDGSYDFAWDSVKPMKGSTPSITSSTLVDVGCVCMLNDWIAAVTILRRQPQLLPVQVEGQASQCRQCCTGASL